MASAAFNRWDRAGRPFELATPVQEILAWANQNDVPVLGTIGNDDHLEAVPPQDHTPFSATWWPVELDGWMVTAIDLANVVRDGVTLGHAIEAQARAGLLLWLKYMNHAGRHLDVRDLDGDGQTWEVYPSSDEHVHLSLNTLWQRRSVGVFNPFGGIDMFEDKDRTHLWNANQYGAELLENSKTFGVGPYGGANTEKPNNLRAQLDRIESAGAGPVITPEQFEEIHERVMRKILGGVDGAVPPA